MRDRLQAILEPVRERQRLDRALRWGLFGLIAGALVGSIVFLAFQSGILPSRRLGWVALGLFPLIAAWMGVFWPTSWQSSARLVDDQCALKDRTITALDFAARSQREDVHELQMQDAVRHLVTMDAAEVVPWQWPRYMRAAGAAMAVLVVLAWTSWPDSDVVANVPPEPLTVVLDQAELLEDTLLEEIEELAAENEQPELQELAEDLQRVLRELKDPEGDQREALASLSDMQAALQTVLRQMNTQQIDAQLQALADALQVSESTQAACRALRESEYEKAADELEKIDATALKRKEQDAMAKNLTQMCSALGQGSQGQLSESVQELLEGLETRNSSKCKSALIKASRLCRKQMLKKKISNCLSCQLNRLSSCKQAVISQCQSPAQKSDRSSQSAGMASSNKPFGDERTQLDSARRSESITGQSGAGPSEQVTVATDQARQDAARSYRQRYAEYRKQMEEVIDSEPLPLGHRETVKRYFESIRPSNAELETVDPVGGGSGGTAPPGRE